MDTDKEEVEKYTSIHMPGLIQLLNYVIYYVKYY